MGHVIGSKSSGGMKVSDNSFLRQLYFTFEYLRMPLFTVISGWVYTLSPVKRSQLVSFTIKKIRRVILPLIFVGGLYYIVQSMVPNTNKSYELKDIWRILIFPYTFYWYLYSLFIIFLVISIIDVFKMADKFYAWLMILTVSILVLIIRDDIIPNSVQNYFGFKNAIYLLPFFLIGVGIKRFDSIFKNQFLFYSTSLILIVGLIFQQLVWYKVLFYVFSPNYGLGLIIGIAGVITLMHIHFKNKSLAWLGNFAYTIFLFHSFGTSGGRILLNASGIQNTVVVFFVSLVLGLFFPILIENILDRFGITRMLYLGRSYTKK